mmetsp:Transcript_610/g.1763  ORF Transcript_610/g.1763 Transcript_610/m.1763 type:complete len:141 (+) Transcript_610:936-1358(+)
MCSSMHTARPTEDMRSSTFSWSWAVVLEPMAKVEAAWPMEQGVLGITRTTRAPSGSSPSSVSSVIPAAMEITRWRSSKKRGQLLQHSPQVDGLYPQKDDVIVGSQLLGAALESVGEHAEAQAGHLLLPLTAAHTGRHAVG